MEKIIDFNTGDITNVLHSVQKLFKNANITFTINYSDKDINDDARLSIGDTLMIRCREGNIHVYFSFTNEDGCVLLLHREATLICRDRCYEHMDYDIFRVSFDNSVESFNWIVDNIPKYLENSRDLTTIEVDDPYTKDYIKYDRYYLHEGKVVLYLDCMNTFDDNDTTTKKQDKVLSEALLHEYLVSNGYNDHCFEQVLCVYRKQGFVIELIKIYYHGYDCVGNGVLLVCANDSINIASKAELDYYMAKE